MNQHSVSGHNGSRVNGLGSLFLSKMDNLNSHIADMSQRIASLEELLPHRADVDGPAGTIEDWTQFVFEGIVAASGSTTFTQLNDSSGHFDVAYITGTKSPDANTNYELRIRENFQGKYMQHRGDFIEFANAVGTAERPYWLKGRRRFRANSTIQIEINNLTAIQTTIQIVFHGMKVMV